MRNKTSYPIDYVPSQFTSKDYRVLYNFATPGSGIRSRINDSRFRDKRIQRELLSTFPKAYEVLKAPYKDLAKYINVSSTAAQDILKWRLQINK